MMATGLRSVLLLWALAWTAMETEALETFDDFREYHADYPGLMGNKTKMANYCNKIMKERGLTDEKRHMFINLPDDDLIKICRTVQGDPMTIKYWTSFEKIPLTECRIRVRNVETPYDDYVTSKKKDAILVRCEEGFPVRFLGTGTAGLGR